MKKFGTKQLIPLAMALMGIIFAWIGFTQLGFWDKEPKAGFFPTIIAIVMVIARRKINLPIIKMSCW